MGVATTAAPYGFWANNPTKKLAHWVYLLGQPLSRNRVFQNFSGEPPPPPLKDINPSQTADPDGIHGMVLKNGASTLAKPLTLMFNISFVTGSIPNEWNLASVIPVHKKVEKGSVVH